LVIPCDHGKRRMIFRKPELKLKAATVLLHHLPAAFQSLVPDGHATGREVRIVTKRGALLIH